MENKNIGRKYSRWTLIIPFILLNVWCYNACVQPIRNMTHWVCCFYPKMPSEMFQFHIIFVLPSQFDPFLFSHSRILCERTHPKMGKNEFQNMLRQMSPCCVLWLTFFLTQTYRMAIGLFWLIFYFLLALKNNFACWEWKVFRLIILFGMPSQTY